MKLYEYSKQRPIEQMIFKVKPELIEDFIKYDHEIWTEFLANQNGFISKEVWQSETNIGELTTIIVWDKLDSWANVDKQELIKNATLFDEKIGIENYEVLEICYLKNRNYKVREYK